MLTGMVRLVPKTDRRPLLRELIRRDFSERPGLALTVEEGRLLWGLDRSTCSQLLDSLVADGLVRPAPDGRYRRVPERCHQPEPQAAGS